MSVKPDDIRAAVANGTISETQAVGILALAEAREGYRLNAADIDEPFELFRGFNEIFIVAGLSILYFGAVGLVSLLNIFDVRFVAPVGLLIVLTGLYFLSVYFTNHRRMVAPSIALTIMVALAASYFGVAIAMEFNLSTTWLWSDPNLYLSGFTAALFALIIFWIKFRVPFAIACIGLGVYGVCFSLLVAQGVEFDSIENIFLLSGSGTFAWLTITLGLIGFGIAMWFDMSDPHRVTRRAAQAFWLHVISASAIVNPIAVSLLATDNALTYMLLAWFLLFMGCLAVIIDRRSFLLSALTYMVALAIILTRDTLGSSIIFVSIGAILVALGAFWERWRRALLNILPNFPCKDRLPPWQLTI